MNKTLKYIQKNLTLLCELLYLYFIKQRQKQRAMKSIVKINAAELSVGMVIVGQTTISGVNKFKVKNVCYSSDGKFVRYKADRIAPNYLSYDGTFSKHITEKIRIENN